MISIIIPIYNGEQHIDRCLDSVLNQTYKDVEVILIDDCSQDNSFEKCIYYTQKDKRVYTYHNNTNRGVSYSRNLGVDNAKGEYICFVDIDDIFYNINSLQLLYRPEYDLVCGNFELIRDNMIVDKRYHLCTTITYLDQETFCQKTCDYINKPQGTNNLYSDVWAKLHKTSIIKNNNIRFNEYMTKDEVVAFSIEYSIYVKSCLLLPNIVYKYYSTEEIKYYNKYQKGNGNMVFNMMETFQKAQQYLKSIKISTHKKDSLMLNFINYYLKRYLYYNNMLELLS
jgi:glycosyltransferase involved in cell wall biosynthesis